MLCGKRDLASATVEPTVLASVGWVYWCDMDMDQYPTPTDTVVHITELFIHTLSVLDHNAALPFCFP
jgi:hypothetical protein